MNRNEMICVTFQERQRLCLAWHLRHHSQFNDEIARNVIYYSIIISHCLLQGYFCSITTNIILPSFQYYDIRKRCEGSLCYDFSSSAFTRHLAVHPNAWIEVVLFFSSASSSSVLRLNVHLIQLVLLVVASNITATPNNFRLRCLKQQDARVRFVQQPRWLLDGAPASTP